MGILLIVIGLVIMTVLAVKGIPILWAALVAGVFVLATAGLNIVEGITVTYMTGFSGYIMNYFLMFVLGAIFGKLCEVSGASDSIAQAVVNKLGEKYVVLAIIVAAAILAFGGVSLFVALFTLYPLAMSLFKRADIPRRLFPGVYIAGAATFAMTAPFTPSTQNIVPMAYLGTTLSAGMVSGLIGTVFCAVVVCIYMQWRVGSVKAKGEHYVPLAGEVEESGVQKDLPGLIIALIPMIVLILALNAFGLNVVVGLFIGCVVAVVLYWKWLPHTMAEFWKQITAGADIAAMKDMNSMEGLAYAKTGQAVYRHIEEVRKPFIAAINGFALGGGCELTLACDLRIASTKAKLGLPETGLGIVPGFGGTQRLPRLIGDAKAKELIFTADIIGAEEALAVGLVNRVAEPEVLMDETMKLAGDILAKAPIAVGFAKDAINRGKQVDMDSAEALEALYVGMCFSTDDLHEGMTAFVEKRTAAFKSK